MLNWQDLTPLWKHKDIHPHRCWRNFLLTSDSLRWKKRETEWKEGVKALEESEGKVEICAHVWSKYLENKTITCLSERLVVALLEVKQGWEIFTSCLSLCVSPSVSPSTPVLFPLISAASLYSPWTQPHLSMAAARRVESSRCPCVRASHSAGLGFNQLHWTLRYWLLRAALNSQTEGPNGLRNWTWTSRLSSCLQHCCWCCWRWGQVRISFSNISKYFILPLNVNCL